MELINKGFSLSKNSKTLLIILIFSGLFSLVFGFLFMPQRAWSNVLLNGFFLTGIGICGISMVAIHYVSNSGWDVTIRKVPESMFKILPIGFILMVSLYFGLHFLYEWSHKEVVLNDPILKGKEVWLNPVFFMVRMGVYFIFWYFVGEKIVRASVQQDMNGGLATNKTARRWSALWLYIGGIFFIVASFDWIMSLVPHWYSTIFGLYNFSGMFTSGISMMIILLIYLKKKEVFGEYVKIDHLFELGRYLFSFVTFWVYIWFCQHMLIWYANIPEETIYYIKRHIGIFGSLTVLNVCFNWLFPFILLLFRKTKRDEKYLLIASLSVLIGRWIDLYLMIFPANNKTPVFGIPEIGTFAGAIAVFLLVFFRAFGKGDPVPKNSPYLNESTSLHT